MTRDEIKQIIGLGYVTSNLENGEFSYLKALKSIGKKLSDYQDEKDSRGYRDLDIRFENNNIVVLVECKDSFLKENKIEIQRQLQAYVRYEKVYSDKKIIAILAETTGNDIWVWYGQSVIIDDAHKKNDEKVLKSLEEYEKLYFGKVNDKIKVIDSIKILNEKMHSCDINEKLRSQFVGTCLLALKNGLTYENITKTIDANGHELSPEKSVISNIKSILSGLLSKNGEITDLNKAGKLSILNNKVLDDQDISNLTYKELKNILEFIDLNIIPYINDKNTAGQDLLNLFFTTFNKYVGKSDKNQAFTPDHICSFMSKAVGVNKNSIVLDPCCGSGAFLVRAMTDAMDDCDTEDERDKLKKTQIFGIECEDVAFGLSSTNMLIHGDGNSNVIQESMFRKEKWIHENKINIVLMNPPYNAVKKSCDPEYVKDWQSNANEDPTKGLHFVEWIARAICGKKKTANCKIAVLLPMQTAIGTKGEIKKFKKKMLDSFTLDAVFSLPNEMFYPGASVVACCMIFDLSQKHDKTDRDTFFGYFKDDKFIKRKGLGRVEQTDSNGNSLWKDVEALWLNLYRNRREMPGLSVVKKVSYEDEWLAEAYMETDYNNLKQEDFQFVLNSYIAHLVKEGYMYEN